MPKDEVRRLYSQIETNEAKRKKERIDHLKTVVRLQDLRKDQVRCGEVEMHRIEINANRGDINQHDFLIDYLRQRVTELEGVPDAAPKAESQSYASTILLQLVTTDLRNAEVFATEDALAAAKTDAVEEAFSSQNLSLKTKRPTKASHRKHLSQLDAKRLLRCRRGLQAHTNAKGYSVVVCWEPSRR
ncbi:hypothetical protein KJ359_004702 [Pestalotiopsis sp. 9143b]|nr:hypothetical protein KJ359_004702 [Pestalotiopsis sp. 9143b]